MIPLFYLTRWMEDTYQQKLGVIIIMKSYYFYKKILPNLGWKEIKPLIFERSKEILELKTTVSQDEISIIFSVYPSNKTITT